MRVEQLGTGEPELAIVGGIHGDEPSGVRAIERLLAEDPDVNRPVTLIVANERALEENVRYVDADLNRAFGAAVDADAHERQLATDLANAVRGTTVLSIHSTQSTTRPFALCSGVDDTMRDLVPQLSVTALVDTGSDVEGRLFAAEARIVEIEAGYQQSAEAAENAYRIAREFLATTGALPGDTVAHDIPIFEQGQPVAKPEADEYEVFADNFQQVDAGETYAAADGDPLVAEKSFYPVLFSAYGYENIFGYTSQPVETLSRSSEDVPTIPSGP